MWKWCLAVLLAGCGVEGQSEVAGETESLEAAALCRSCDAGWVGVRIRGDLIEQSTGVEWQETLGGVVVYLDLNDVDTVEVQAVAPAGGAAHIRVFDGKSGTWSAPAPSVSLATPAAGQEASVRMALTQIEDEVPVTLHGYVKIKKLNSGG